MAPFPEVTATPHRSATDDHDHEDGHQHGAACGHPAVPHGDHVDYVHDGHRHAVHGEHYDEH
jgi:zinc transport system permease protein